MFLILSIASTTTAYACAAQNPRCICPSGSAREAFLRENCPRGGSSQTNSQSSYEIGIMNFNEDENNNNPDHKSSNPHPSSIAFSLLLGLLGIGFLVYFARYYCRKREEVRQFRLQRILACISQNMTNNPQVQALLRAQTRGISASDNKDEGIYPQLPQKQQQPSQQQNPNAPFHEDLSRL